MYVNYRKSSYDLWVKTELSSINKYLNLSHSIDGGYHQYIGATGYRSSSLLGNVGFYDTYGSQDPCCNIYPNPNNTSEKSIFLNNFAYTNGISEPTTSAHALGICETLNGGTCSEKRGLITINQSFAGNEITGSCSGAYATTNVYCDCNNFIIAGVTGYGKEFSSETSAQNVVTDGGGVFVLNQDGKLCKDE